MIKIKVGGKYRMRAYPSEYLYVHILGKDIDIIPCESWEHNRFFGVIIYKHGLIDRITYDPNLCSWGEDGSWDGAYLDDCNAIISEWKEESL